MLNQQQLQSHQELHPGFNAYWPTVTEISDFDVAYHSKINPLQFWNLEFKNKHPAFIRLNFTLPWGSNFAVYGRRNVAPSVTQYDFVEFVKGGRIDRLKREAVDFNDHPWKRDTSSVLFIQNKPRNGTKLKKPEILEHHDEKRSIGGKNVTKRSNAGDTGSVLMVNVTLLQYFDTGVWFVSVYNDDVRPHEVKARSYLNRILNCPRLPIELCFPGESRHIRGRRRVDSVSERLQLARILLFREMRLHRRIRRHRLF